MVEVNPFKHLVHLALSLSTASDAVVKKYLAECLRDLQTRHEGTCTSALEMYLINSNKFKFKPLSLTSSLDVELLRAEGEERK